VAAVLEVFELSEFVDAYKKVMARQRPNSNLAAIHVP
jgi:hypothetical protein